MAELTREQVEDWREALLKLYFQASMVPEFLIARIHINALCDLALRGLEQNSAAQVSNQPKGSGIQSAPARADLVARLRDFEQSDELGNGNFAVCYEAADLIERLVHAYDALHVQLSNQEDAERDAALRK